MGSTVGESRGVFTVIIELFGPQRVGKTTFTRALAAQLQERQQTVDLVLSYRPAERLRPDTPLRNLQPDGAAAVVNRLIRPVIELLAMTRHPLDSSHDVRTTSSLMRALPPKSLLSSIRLYQYILRLSRSWHLASESSHISVFDQAFVQAVSSLALFCRAADEALILDALDLIPKPDVLIRLDAPADILTARVCNRQRLQSVVERMLEIDPIATMEANRIFERLHDMLRTRGEAVIAISTSDPRSLADEASRTAELVTTKFRSLHQKHRVFSASLSSEECQHV
jgi:thymidylate kinase